MSEEIRGQRDIDDLEPNADTTAGGVGPAAGMAPAREGDPVSHTERKPTTAVGPTNREPETMMPLFSSHDTLGLRSRWESLQVAFVDEPRHAVEEADRLVTETVESLSKGFAAERGKLEKQWHRGEDVSTEDLRLALRRYRSFFERLLSI